VGVVFWSTRRDDSPPISTQTSIHMCQSGRGYDLAKQSVILLGEPDKHKELEELVEEITNLSHYRQDPICLVPVVRFHIRTLNREEAKDHLATFEHAYDAQKVSDF